jgi:hypothetical protein
VGLYDLITVGQWLRRIAALIAIAVAPVGCGGGSGHGAATTFFGRMAGYVWSGSVTSVRGAWSVPAMAPDSGEAHASTWIGAQTLAASPSFPFIQVGTTEDRATESRPVYAAFWTDTKRGYHPQLLFHVRPGDRIATALTLVAGRWQVVIADATSGRRAVFLTREEGDAAFNLAEWLQEDPSETSGQATPYPSLSEVRFTRLAADGAQPPYADMYAQWMSVRGVNLAPTPVRDGGFSITRGVLSPAGRRYLEIARPQNAAARRIDLLEARWTDRTPAREIRSATAAAATSEAAYAAGLARTHWPAAVQSLAQSLARRVRAQAGMFAEAARSAPASLALWRRRLARLTPDMLRLAHRVRRALHLPELVSGQLPPSSGR